MNRKRKSKAKSPKRRFYNLFFRMIALLAGLIIIIVAFLFLLVYAGAFGPLPGRGAISDISNEEASLVISSDGSIIGKYFAENRTNISREEIPEHLVQALVATEDKRFFSHRGYDTRSYMRVLVRSIFLGDRSGGGGSTLTQQLVKNLYGRDNTGWLSMPVNKIREVILAIRFEDVFSKEELLLLYLNSVPFGEDAYGIESAAQRFFGKPAFKLRVEESAVLVGMLKANTYFSPILNPENSRIRRNTVLQLMEDADYLDPAIADSLRGLPLTVSYSNLSLNPPAGYFVYQVRKQASDLLEEINQRSGRDYNLETDGLKIYTTLNLKLQKMAMESARKHLMGMQPKLDKELEAGGMRKLWYRTVERESPHPDKDLAKRNVSLFSWDGIITMNISHFDSIWYYRKMLNAAVFAVRPGTGEILSWVGGNHFRILPFDMVLSHRQIASAFKPVLYAAAIESGAMPCTYLENEEKSYPEYKDWKPENFDHRSTPDSTVALWYALSHSMNLPAVDLYFKTDPDSLAILGSRLKLPDFPEDAPSVALGTLDVSLYEIVRAFGAFAKDGMMAEPYMITRICDANDSVLYEHEKSETQRVMEAYTAQVVTAILQRAIDQGTGTALRNRYGIHSALAGKTGTAHNYSNAWFISYTPELVTGVWVGASTPDIHFSSASGSGSALALPVAAGLLKGAEKDPALKKEFLKPFQIPEYIYETMDCDPYRQKGADGFFRRLFGGKDKQEEIKKEPEKVQEAPKQDTLEKESGVKKFFKRIFNKKKK